MRGRFCCAAKRGPAKRIEADLTLRGLPLIRAINLDAIGAMDMLMPNGDNISTVRCPYCKSETPDISVCLTCGKEIKGEKRYTENRFFQPVFEKILGALDLNRLISAIIALIYLAVSAYLLGGKGFFRMLQFLILPMACIWYGDDLGNYTGTLLSRGISRPSAGCAVIVAGWILLFLPLFAAAYIYFAVGKK